MSVLVERTEKVRLDTLNPWPENPRHGDEEAIQESLDAHGQYRPIVVNRAGRMVLAGNHVYAGALALGWTHVLVSWVDVDPEQAKRIAIVDNRLSQLGGYDEAMLLSHVQAFEDELQGTGFDEQAVEALLQKVVRDAQAAIEPTYELLVSCATPDQREALAERLEGEGLTVRALRP